jgi:L-alanine-DL-glutamate epimerase-like enolase superfamily enzyme
MRRRSFLKHSATAAMAAWWADESLPAAADAGSTSTSAKPSELKITDMRVAVLKGVPTMAAIIRIDTNQGLYGLGEVRDGASKNYALFLKSRLLGENPCNVDKLFRKIKQFGHHGRQAGGVCGVEMALWDLAGKAYQVPVYQLLGGRFRDRVRIYTDTTTSKNPKVYAERLKARMDQGFTFLKMDLGTQLLQNIPGTVTRPSGLSFQEQSM